MPESPHGSAGDSAAFVASTVDFAHAASANDFAVPMSAAAFEPEKGGGRYGPAADYGADYGQEYAGGQDSSRHSDGSHHSSALADCGSFYLPPIADLLPSKPYAFRHAAPVRRSCLQGFMSGL